MQKNLVDFELSVIGPLLSDKPRAGLLVDKLASAERDFLVSALEHAVVQSSETLRFLRAPPQALQRMEK